MIRTAQAPAIQPKFLKPTWNQPLAVEETDSESLETIPHGWSREFDGTLEHSPARSSFGSCRPIR